jgi:hypothetical protein
MPTSINWTEELENSVLDDIEAGLSLRASAFKYSISASAIIRHIQASETFAKQYARAKEIQLETMAEEMLDIADDTSSDTRTIMRGEKEIEVQNAEWINRCRLQVDTRKWLLSKLVPKKYGDRVEQFISGPDGGPIQAAITVEFVKPNPQS